MALGRIQSMDAKKKKWSGAFRDWAIETGQTTKEYYEVQSRELKPTRSYLKKTKPQKIAGENYKPIPSPESNGLLEAPILSAILKFLESKKLFYIRISMSGVFRNLGGGQGVMTENSAEGISDIIVPYNQYTFWLEVKSNTGEQSPSQKTFELNIKRSGQIYKLVTSVRQVEEILIKYGVLKNDF
jgi:hypothetical protein